ncbi:MAG: DUF3459 domain-containing protein [Ilumatobacteraceae bacterium]
MFVISESDLNDPTLVDPGPDAPAALDAVWSDDLHHALHVALTREADGYYADYVGWEDVARALERVYVYDGRMSMHRGRQHGSPVDDRPRRAFVVSVQNHDQVGNRATGTRLGHLVGPAELEAAAAVVLCSPFVPMLFQGEEWAASTPFLYATDHTDPAIAEAVTTGRRREFGSFVSFTDEVPDPQAEATFRASVLDWDEREHDPHASVLRWYRRLIEMRRTHPALRTHGPLDTSAAWHPDTGAFVMMRGQRLMVVVAAGDEPVDVSTLAVRATCCSPTTPRGATTVCSRRVAPSWSTSSGPPRRRRDAPARRAHRDVTGGRCGVRFAGESRGVTSLATPSPLPARPQDVPPSGPLRWPRRASNSPTWSVSTSPRRWCRCSPRSACPMCTCRRSCAPFPGRDTATTWWIHTTSTSIVAGARARSAHARCARPRAGVLLDVVPNHLASDRAARSGQTCCDTVGRAASALVRPRLGVGQRAGARPHPATRAGHRARRGDRRRVGDRRSSRLRGGGCVYDATLPLSNESLVELATAMAAAAGARRATRPVRWFVGLVACRAADRRAATGHDHRRDDGGPAGGRDPRVPRL